MIERPKISRAVWEALKSNIMKERQRKKQEQEADEEEERQRIEREREAKQNVTTLEETKEQINQLESKLALLKEEKHQLFLQLKKVLNEDETRRRQSIKDSNEPVHSYVMLQGPHGTSMQMGTNSPTPPHQGPPAQVFIQQGMPLPPGRSAMFKVQQAVIQQGGPPNKRQRSPSPPPPQVFHQQSYAYKPTNMSAYPQQKLSAGVVRAQYPSSQSGPYYPSAQVVAAVNPMAYSSNGPQVNHPSGIQPVYTYQHQQSAASIRNSLPQGQPPQMHSQHSSYPGQSQREDSGPKHYQQATYLSHGPHPGKAYIHQQLLDQQKQMQQINSNESDKFYSSQQPQPQSLQHGQPPPGRGPQGQHVLHTSTLPILQQSAAPKSGSITSGFPINRNNQSSHPPHPSQMSYQSLQQGPSVTAARSVYISTGPPGSSAPRLVYTQAPPMPPHSLPPGHPGGPPNHPQGPQHRYMTSQHPNMRDV